VRGEIRAGLSDFPQSLFQATVQLYRDFHRAQQRPLWRQPAGAGASRIPAIRLRIGGRDGHPGLRVEITALAWWMQAQTVHEEYMRRVQAVSAMLSFSLRQYPRRPS